MKLTNISIDIKTFWGVGFGKELQVKTKRVSIDMEENKSKHRAVIK